LARWIETLAELNCEIEHCPGRLRCNADGVSRPTCKQCWGKSFPAPWIDELERAVELPAPLGVHALAVEPDISNDELHHLQREDEIIVPIIHLLEDDIDPTRDQLRAMPLRSRNLWSQRPHVRFKESLLVREKPNNNNQLVVPEILQRRLFDAAHSGPLAAQLGAQRMFLQLTEHYHWPGMKRDIDTWCLECQSCQQSKPAPSRAHGKLQKVITGAPMDMVAIDILSGLPTATSWSVLTISQNGQRLMHSHTQKHSPASLFCTIIYLQDLAYQDSYTQTKVEILKANSFMNCV